MIEPTKDTESSDPRSYEAWPPETLAEARRQLIEDKIINRQEWPLIEELIALRERESFNRGVKVGQVHPVVMVGNETIDLNKMVREARIDELENFTYCGASKWEIDERIKELTKEE
jgi:hypothetical protein